MKIYIVEGQSWDIRNDGRWIVCGFTSEEKANNLAKLAEKEAIEIFYKKGEVKEGENKYDPQGRIYEDDLGFQYVVHKVEIIE